MVYRLPRGKGQLSWRDFAIQFQKRLDAHLLPFAAIPPVCGENRDPATLLECLQQMRQSFVRSGMQVLVRVEFNEVTT